MLHLLTSKKLLAACEINWPQCAKLDKQMSCYMQGRTSANRSVKLQPLESGQSTESNKHYWKLIECISIMKRDLGLVSRAPCRMECLSNMGGTRQIEYSGWTKTSTLEASVLQEKRPQTTSDPLLVAVEAKKKTGNHWSILFQENYMEEGLEEWPSGSGKSRVLRIPRGQDKNKNIFNIGTWNAQNMFEARKLGNVIQEMSRLNINTIGISQTWRRGSGECNR